MAIYAIGDLHLSNSSNKPMDIFGSDWDNHAEKIKEDWKTKVKKDDFVIMPRRFQLGYIFRRYIFRF